MKYEAAYFHGLLKEAEREEEFKPIEDQLIESSVYLTLLLSDFASASNAHSGEYVLSLESRRKLITCSVGCTQL